jgi:hypothetical protein
VLDYAGLKRRLNGISSIRRKLSLGNLQKISKALAITLSELFKTVEKRVEAGGRVAVRWPEKRQPLVSR